MAKAKKPSSANKSASKTGTQAAGAEKPSDPRTTSTAKAEPAKASTETSKATGTPTSDAKRADTAKPSETPKSAQTAIKPDSDAKDKSSAPQDTGSSASQAAKDAGKAKSAKASSTSKTSSSTATASAKSAGTVVSSASGGSSAESSAKADPADQSNKGDTSGGNKESKPAAAPATSPPAAAPATSERRGSVFLPLVLGGVVAGGLGFAAAELNFLNIREGTERLETTLSQQGAQIKALEEAEPEMPDVEGLRESIAALSETVTGLEARLAELEARPTIVTESTGEAVELGAELTALQASVEAQKDEIARLLENARSVEEATAEAARQAAVQGALTEITAAVNTGGGYADAVQVLSENVDAVPDALNETASDGVVSLLSLQTAFPETARTALAAARAAGVDGEDPGVAGFLRRQLGARSVAPRDGDDPDAVLSRVEAAVRAGDLSGAMAEIDALPAEVQDAMGGWLSDARARAAVERAVDDLSQRLAAN